MGDGVTGAGSAPPANQTTNAGNSGASSPADAAKFGEALKQESLCPEGLGRPPHVAGMPRRYDPPCTYLRDPSQPANLKVQGDPDRFKSPIITRSNGPDYSKPIRQLDSNPLSGVKVPDGLPSHNTGIGQNDGGHFLSIPVWGTPQEESPDQTPYKPPR
jgi:hypothetical protein